MATQTITMTEEETKVRKLSDNVNSEGGGEEDEPVDEPDSKKQNNNGVLLGAQRIMNTQYSQTTPRKSRGDDVPTRECYGSRRRCWR